MSKQRARDRGIMNGAIIISRRGPTLFSVEITCFTASPELRGGAVFSPFQFEKYSFDFGRCSKGGRLTLESG